MKTIDFRQPIWRSLFVLVFLSVSGCDKPSPASQPTTEPDAKSPATPAAESAGQAAAPEPDISLRAGQPEEEVRQLLGKPDGVMRVSNQTVLLYSGRQLEFLDGKLTAPASNVLHQIELNSEAAKRRLATAPKENGNWLKKTAVELKQKVNTVTAREVYVTNRNGERIDHSRLVTKGKITVVDFYATWCGPCRTLSPILQDIVRGQSDVVLRKVDIRDWGSATTERYHVTSVPNVRVFDSRGRLVAPPTSNPDMIKQYIQLARKQSD